MCAYDLLSIVDTPFRNKKACCQALFAASHATCQGPSLCSLNRTQVLHHSPSVHSIFISLILSDAHWKLKVDPFPRQSPIDLGVSIEPKVHTPALLLVQHYLRDLGAVLAGANTLADDLDRVDDIGEDGVVHGGQGT